MLTFKGNPCPLKRQENLLQSGISVRNCLQSFSHCWVQSLKCVYNVQRTREDVFCSGNSHLRERESFLRRLPQLFFVSPWLKLGHKSSKNAIYTSISQSLVIDIRMVGAALKPIKPILRGMGTVPPIHKSCMEEGWNSLARQINGCWFGNQVYTNKAQLPISTS